MEYVNMKPFLKWVGGKSQLLPEIRKRYPSRIKKYCEPFVGGGAVLFDILANFKPESVLINDINPELINAYIQIRDHSDSVISILGEMQEVFWKKDEKERKEFYYSQRNRFNHLISDGKASVEKAALFIFINKTCFNGLYRVNAKGLYNVPMGAYKQPLICDRENLKRISQLLNGVQIKCGDYSECDYFIDADSFVYIDPPYRPLNTTSSFTSYSAAEFGDKQQRQLAAFIEHISKKGALVVASNSDPKNTDENDDFFDEIYQKFIINRVTATRMINSKSTGRGAINELLIANFQEE